MTLSNCTIYVFKFSLYSQKLVNCFSLEKYNFQNNCEQSNNLKNLLSRVKPTDSLSLRSIPLLITKNKLGLCSINICAKVVNKIVPAHSLPRESIKTRKIDKVATFGQLIFFQNADR